VVHWRNPLGLGGWRMSQWFIGVILLDLGWVAMTDRAPRRRNQPVGVSSPVVSMEWRVDDLLMYSSSFGSEGFFLPPTIV